MRVIPTKSLGDERRNPQLLWAAGCAQYLPSDVQPSILNRNDKPGREIPHKKEQGCLGAPGLDPETWETPVFVVALYYDCRRYGRPRYIPTCSTERTRI